jgi:hypothetical protein
VVEGTVDPQAMSFLDLSATPRALPWLECPAAAGSADRLVGTSVADVRSRVTASFTGTSTCTHLNDTLRSLEDIAVLAALVGLPSPKETV